MSEFGKRIRKLPDSIEIEILETFEKKIMAELNILNNCLALSEDFVNAPKFGLNFECN
jgi:hypothetical protein